MYVARSAPLAPDARAHHVAEDVDEKQQEHDRREEQVQREGRVAPGVQQVAAQHRGRVADREGEGAHRTASFGWWVGAGTGAPVRAKKTSSRSGVCTVSSSASTPSRVEPVEDGAQVALAAVAGDLERQRLVVPGASAQGGGGGPVGGRVGEPQPDVSAGHDPLQLLGAALGRDPPAVEDGDAVGQLVGLLQVLGGEEDGDAVGHQLADDPPHGVARTRVETRGRLVEEDDPRAADQRHGDVEAAFHAAGVAGGGLLRRLNEVEPLQQFGGDPPPLPLGQVVQVGHEQHVLLAGDQPVDGGELPGDADRGPYGVRFGGQVVTGDAQLAGVGGDEGGEDLDGGGLARAVGAEQGEDAALRHRQVDAVQDDLVAVGLAQSGGGDQRAARPGRRAARGSG